MHPINRPGGRILAYLIAAIAFALVPVFITDPYIIHIVILMGTFAIGALGVWLVLTAGQWNFGQAGFFAIGSYVAALLTVNTNLPPFWATVPLAGLFAAVVALALGYLSLRTRGLYFAILTLAFGLAVRQCVIAFPGLTMGFTGIHDIAGPAPFHLMGLTLDFEASKTLQYYLMYGLVGATILVLDRINTSRLGKVFRAIAQSDLLCQSLGISSLRYQLLAFVISAFFAGLAGAFTAHYTHLAHPDYFGLWQSVYMIIYVVFGGVASIPGVLLGSSTLYGLLEILKLAAGLRQVLYAAVIILVMLFLPQGLISIPSVVREQMAKLRGRKKGSYPLHYR